MKATDVLIHARRAVSKSEARRYIHEGAVFINGNRLIATEDNPDPNIDMVEGDTIRIGHIQTKFVWRNPPNA